MRESSSVHTERLPFTLPAFTRVIWVSDRAREVWSPRIARINALWATIECESVVQGVRPCALSTVTLDNVVRHWQRWTGKGQLVAAPIHTVGLDGSGYQYSVRVPKGGARSALRVVLGEREAVTEFTSAWQGNDDAAIGRLLGYPECCTRFFGSVWSKDRWLDTTLPMARNTASAVRDGESFLCNGPMEANILWRWMGVRAVPHLPCSFDCDATARLGAELLSLGGRSEEVAWMREILSWPVEWSALHGIALIRTPILKVSAMTDATAAKHVVSRDGSPDAYPVEGAVGLDFPYRAPKTLKVSASKSALDGRNHLVRLRNSRFDFADNGFASRAAMDSCHASIVETAWSCLEKMHGGTVVDLGCGNGILLETISARTGALPVGVEKRGAIAATAMQRLTRLGGRVEVGDFFELGPEWWTTVRPHLVLLMVGRLLEVDGARAGRLLADIKGTAANLLLYAYADQISKHGDLVEMGRKAGLHVPAMGSGPTVLLTKGTPWTVA